MTKLSADQGSPSYRAAASGVPADSLLINFEILLWPDVYAVQCGTARRNVGHRWRAELIRRWLARPGPDCPTAGSLRCPEPELQSRCFNRSNGGLFGLRLCGQMASAMHASELQIYATLALIIVLSVLIFPPKDGAHPLSAGATRSTPPPT